MKVLLLCGYRTSENSEDALGLAREADGQRALDNRIQELSRLGFEVITVLAGAQADEQLRLCPRIANTEMVFDTSDHVNLASNLKAGLAATDSEGCFVLPVEVPMPAPELWRFLNQEWGRQGFHTETQVFQAVDAQGAPWHFGFPLLLTKAGNHHVRKLTGFLSLVDPRLSYSQLVYLPQSEVAPEGKAL